MGRANAWRVSLLCVSFMALFSCGLTAAVNATAAYRQVENFGGVPGEKHSENGLEGGATGRPYRELWPERLQLGGVGGLAVNYTGAGGVPAGTLYGTGKIASERYVSRYKPDRGFSEAWAVVSQENEEAAEAGNLPTYERCGPEGEVVEKEGHSTTTKCLSRPTSGGDGDIEVDQTTGDVYVYAFPSNVGKAAVTVYNPDGSAVITRFALQAPSGESVTESPAKVHSDGGPGALAVDGQGTVYLYDEGNPNFYHRLMVFKPKTPGVYDEYEYTGTSNDVAAGSYGEGESPSRPITDAAGNIYVANEQNVEEYDPADPGNPPICRFFFKKGGIQSMTVDPLTGAVFFYSYLDRTIHHLSPCVGGTFSEVDTVESGPPRKELTALAFDPVGEFEAGLKPGILYAAAPSGEGGATEGKYPETKTESAIGYVFAPASEVAPEVTEEAVSDVTESSARLEGDINPKANPSRYVFEYISDSAFAGNPPSEPFAGALVAPAGGVKVEGAGVVPATATIGGLEPGVLYHYRLVARSFCLPAQPAKECVGAGPGKTFRTFAVQAVGLPDSRAYELVSPIDKSGEQVYPADPDLFSCAIECKPGGSSVRFPMQSSPDGESVAYEGGPFSAGSALIENEYLSKRTADGWVTTDLIPTTFVNRSENGYRAFDPALTRGVLAQGPPALDPSTLPDYGNLYSQSTDDPLSLTPLLTPGDSAPTCGPGNGSGALRSDYVASSSDLSRVYFEADDALTPEAAGACGETNLFEATAGGLRALNLAPGAARTVPGAAFGSGELLQSGNQNIFASVYTHAVSSDGSRVFFTGADGHLYVRIGAAATTEVPGPGNCDRGTPLADRTCFLTASADGDRVLLTNGEMLAFNESAGAYEPAVDLTQGQGGFLGISGQGSDLAEVYFVDTAVISGSGENDRGAAAQAGKDNLYAWTAGQTRFVASLAPTDNGKEFGDWAASPVVRSAEASPSGNWLAFTSVAELTGYENRGAVEAFIYNSQSGRLYCASCSPSGSRSQGQSTLRTIAGARGYLPQPQYLTDTGRLFFDSSSRLVPSDRNGDVEDVYEFEPTGVGSCSQTEYCLNLISPGSGSSDSNFLATDESGANVFFTTANQLVKADTDELIDVYDARSGGGFPEAALPVECKGEACQPAMSAPPQSRPGSALVAGEASPQAVRCKKGKTKVKGRCVKHAAKKKTKKKRKRNGSHGKHMKGSHGRHGDKSKGSGK